MPVSRYEQKTGRCDPQYQFHGWQSPKQLKLQNHIHSYDYKFLSNRTSLYADETGTVWLFADVLSGTLFCRKKVTEKPKMVRINLLPWQHYFP